MVIGSHREWLPASLFLSLFDKRRLWLTEVTKVKGHANEEMVASRQVRSIDQAGNDATDDAADLCSHWYPKVCKLHLEGRLLTLVCSLLGPLDKKRKVKEGSA